MTGCSVVGDDIRSDAEQATLRVDIDRWVALALAAAGHEGGFGELTLTFVGLDEIADLNAEHMATEGPTDVLSFPMEDEALPGVPTMLGDIVVCPEVAARQFGDHAGTLDDELALLVVHGVLHVLGHDHGEPDEARLMREREVALLVDFHWCAPPPHGFRQTHD